MDKLDKVMVGIGITGAVIALALIGFVIWVIIKLMQHWKVI